MTIRLVTQPLDPNQLNSARFPWPTGIQVSAYRVLTVNPLGLAVYFDPESPDYSAVLGLSVTAANQDSDVIVMRGGQLTDSAWAWTPNQPIWAGASGTLTQVPPNAGWLVQVGNALNPTVLQLEFIDGSIRL